MVKEDKSCYVVDMIQEYMKKCREGWHEWGYNTVSHDGITHTSGEQICMHCGVKYSDFLNSIKQPLESIQEKTKEKELHHHFDKYGVCVRCGIDMRNAQTPCKKSEETRPIGEEELS